MPIRKASARWEGDLKNGTGNMSTESGAVEGAFSFRSRFQDGTGTNPDELLGAALAGCFSMALAHSLDEAGHTAKHVDTKANVHFEPGGEGSALKKIELQTEVDAPGLDDDTFQKHAQESKAGCHVSQALAGIEITLDAKLVSQTSA